MRRIPQLWRRPFLVRLQGMERDETKAPFLLEKLNARSCLPIRIGHQDGTPRPNADDRDGGNRGMSPEDQDNRGDYRVGRKTGKTGEL